MTVTRDFSLAAQAIDGGQLRVVDLTSGREVWTAQAADENVTALAFSPDGKKLASGAGFVESAVRLWDVGTGRELARLEGHRTYVRALAFWPDGEKLASASGDQTIHLWDVASLNLVAPPPTPPIPASAQSESSLRPRPARPRVAELHPSATLRGHGLEVWSLALCADNTTLVSGSKDGAVLVWDTATLQRERNHVTLPAPVRAFVLPPGDPAVIAMDERGRVARWQGVDFQQSQPLLELETNSLGACFAADGRFMATASPGSTTKVWDLQQGLLLLCEIGSRAEPEWPVAFFGRSSHLLTQQGRSGNFREWDVPTGREIRSGRFSTPGVMGKRVVSPDERWMVALDSEGAGRLRDLATGQETQFALDLKQVSGAAFSPDGKLLAVVSVLGVGQVWDTATARKTATLHGFLQGTHSVAFSPDSERLAIGSNGNEAVKLWDVASLQEVLTLSGQGSMFNSATFSPDGNILAARNSQGVLHLWRAPSFDEIARLEAKGR
jgi:WD40 repeat protein